MASTWSADSDLERAERVDQPAPGQLRDAAAAGPARAAPMGLGRRAAGRLAGRSSVMARDATRRTARRPRPVAPGRDSHAGLRGLRSNRPRVSRIRTRGRPMKLKLAAVAVLAAVGVGALVYTLGGVSANAADDARVPDRARDRRRRHRRDRRDRHRSPRRRGPASASGWTRSSSTTATRPPARRTYRVTEVERRGRRHGRGRRPAGHAPTAPTCSRELAAATQRPADSAKVSLRRRRGRPRGRPRTTRTRDRIRQAKIGLYDAENQVADAQAKVDDLKAQIAGATLTAPGRRPRHRGQRRRRLRRPGRRRRRHRRHDLPGHDRRRRERPRRRRARPDRDHHASTPSTPTLTGTVTAISPVDRRRQRLGRRVLSRSP